MRKAFEHTIVLVLIVITAILFATDDVTVADPTQVLGRAENTGYNIPKPELS